MRKNVNALYMAAAILCALGVNLTGCVNAPQTPGAPKPVNTIQRGAFSGMPQVVDHYIELSPDCTSLGLETVSITRAPSHGSVVIQNAEYYPSFAPNNQRYQCNKIKSPSLALQYTSDKTFVGTDRFTVHRIGHTGNLIVNEYVVKVEAFHGTDPAATQP
jgi:hypothetical protein